MKPAIFALFAILSFHCAAVPPSQTSQQDPSNPKAPEAPVALPTKVLAQDPPPPAALQDTAASGESHGHGGHAGMGSPDAGAGAPQPPHHHAGMDGGAP
jgi:hypothetical protein